MTFCSNKTGWAKSFEFHDKKDLSKVNKLVCNIGTKNASRKLTLNKHIGLQEVWTYSAKKMLHVVYSEENIIFRSSIRFRTNLSNKTTIAYFDPL